MCKIGTKSKSDSLMKLWGEQEDVNQSNFIHPYYLLMSLPLKTCLKSNKHLITRVLTMKLPLSTSQEPYVSTLKYARNLAYDRQLGS